METRFFSRSLIDQLRSFLHERCPGSLEDSSFLLDLTTILDSAMEELVEQARMTPVLLSPGLVAEQVVVLGVNGSQKSRPALETPSEADETYGASYFRDRNDRLLRALDKLLVAGRFGDTESRPVLEAVRRALVTGF